MIIRRLAAVLGSLAGIYGLFVRPWMLNWGASPEERERTLPGDTIVPDSRNVTTRAVTIDAPPAAIWPWLVQMGQDRAGFYTHNWVERLLRSGIPDVHVLHPEWQELEPGALVRTNHDIGGRPLGWPVERVVPEQALVLRSKNLPVGSYAFVLEPIDDKRTRLIVRDRAVWKTRELLFAALVFEPLHAYMETGLIRGIKRRVEAHRDRELAEPAAGKTRAAWREEAA